MILWDWYTNARNRTKAEKNPPTTAAIFVPVLSVFIGRRSARSEFKTETSLNEMLLTVIKNVHFLWIYIQLTMKEDFLLKI